MTQVLHMVRVTYDTRLEVENKYGFSVSWYGYAVLRIIHTLYQFIVI